MNLYAVSMIWLKSKGRIRHTIKVIPAISEHEAIGKALDEDSGQNLPMLSMVCAPLGCDEESAILAKYEVWDAS